MNFKNTLFCSAALMALVGGATQVSAATYDDALKAKTNGTVTFTVDEDGGGIVDPTDPETPLEPLDPENPGTNPSEGLLRINYITDFEFGDKVADGTAIEAFAKADTNFKDKTLAPFINTEDNRGSAEASPWTLSVFQSKEFTNADHALEKAQIELSNLTYATTPELKGTEPVATAGGAIGKTSENAIPVATSEKNTGLGSWSLAMGSLKGEETDGVKLSIPSRTTINEGVYQAELTWNLAADASAPEA